MHWSEEALYNKAKYYMGMAAREDATSAHFPFWVSLSLELLCRAALAKIHPVLLAEPKDEDNLLYACGQNIGKSPKSIAITTVITRCGKFLPDFDKAHEDRAKKMMETRNAELHSGEAAFHALSTGNWQSEHFSLIKTLLGHLGRTMEDYLGDEIATRASQMLQEKTEETKKSVNQKIGIHRGIARKLEASDLADKRVQAELRIRNALETSQLVKECFCPACESKAIIDGQITDSGAPRLSEGEIIVERRVLPSRFRCFVCDLRLPNFTEMNIANLGAMYTITETKDPIDFFGIVPEEYIDFDELRKEIEDDWRAEAATEYMDE